jgi:hypothetical protein
MRGKRLSGYRSHGISFHTRNLPACLGVLAQSFLVAPNRAVARNCPPGPRAPSPSIQAPQRLTALAPLSQAANSSPKESADGGYGEIMPAHQPGCARASDTHLLGRRFPVPPACQRSLSGRSNASRKTLRHLIKFTLSNGSRQHYYYILWSPRARPTTRSGSPSPRHPKERRRQQPRG